MPSDHDRRVVQAGAGAFCWSELLTTHQTVCWKVTVSSQTCRSQSSTVSVSDERPGRSAARASSTTMLSEVEDRKRSSEARVNRPRRGSAPGSSTRPHRALGPYAGLCPGAASPRGRACKQRTPAPAPAQLQVSPCQASPGRPGQWAAAATSQGCLCLVDRLHSPQSPKASASLSTSTWQCQRQHHHKAPRTRLQHREDTAHLHRSCPREWGCSNRHWMACHLPRRPPEKCLPPSPNPAQHHLRQHHAPTRPAAGASRGWL